jgi:hypothetical protein
MDKCPKLRNKNIPKNVPVVEVKSTEEYVSHGHITETTDK